MVSKRTLLNIHRWAGLTIGLFLIFQGVSGAAVVWRDELLLAQAPQAAAAEANSNILDIAIGMASKRHPDSVIKRFDYPEYAGAPALLRITDHGTERLLFFLPQDGTLLSDRAARSYPSELLYELHSRMLSGEFGRYAVAVQALALLLLVVTGPLFWWPGRVRIRRTLQIRLTGPAHRVVGDLHRVMGVFLCTLLAINALTGFILAMMAETRQLVGAEPPPVTPKETSSRAPQPLIQSVAEVARLFPKQHIKSLRLSGNDLRFVRAVVQAKGPHAWSIDQVWIDRDGGTIIDIQRAETAQRADRALAWVLPLHSWQWIGWPGRFLATLLGALLAGFAISGIYLWARRKLMRRAKNYNGERTTEE